MEDSSDSDHKPCDDGLNKQLGVRKRRIASKASVGRPTITETTKSCTQTRISDLDADQNEKKDKFPESQNNVQVKEEPVSSGEENFSEKEDLDNIETSIVKGSQSNQKQKILKINIGRSKEISEDLRKQVVEAHKKGKGYKKIAKDLDMHQSTVRQIVYKWKKFSTVATLPRSGRPTKIGAKARLTLLKHMTEHPRSTAKDLKASLALDNINVHESTIRKSINKWCSWDFIMTDETNLQQE